MGLHRRLVDAHIHREWGPHEEEPDKSVWKSILIKRGEAHQGEELITVQSARSVWGGAVPLVVQTLELADAPESVRAAIAPASHEETKSLEKGLETPVSAEAEGGSTASPAAPEGSIVASEGESA